MTEEKYTTELSKGQGMIEETMTLLSIWEPGMSLSDFTKAVLEKGALRKATAYRAKDIIAKVFSRRYLCDKGRAARSLRLLVNNGASASELAPLFLIHTARANNILHDFICQTYWRKYEGGATFITKQDALDFLDRAVHEGHIPVRWSDSMTTRVARYLLGTLHDFHLLGQSHGPTREITHPAVAKLSVFYLTHDLHFSGYSDDSVIGHRDWCLFGLDRASVIREAERLSFDGYYVFQNAGDLIRITWKYQNMEDALNVFAKG